MIADRRCQAPRLDVYGNPPKRPYSGPHPRDYDPEGWEARIQNWIAHYDRLGLRGEQGKPERPSTPEQREARRTENARLLAERESIDRKALEMRMCGMTFRGIAAALGCATDTAIKRVNRAREAARNP